jgi:type II secretory pathway pseudopilin PulG
MSDQAHLHFRRGRAQRHGRRAIPFTGFSSLETVISTVLVSITLVAAMNSLAFVIQTIGKDSEAEQASHIAHAWLSQIAALPFRDPVDGTEALGLEDGESPLARAAWDDCDDYHGWSATQLPELAGIESQAVNWGADVQVNYCDVDAPESVTSSTTSLKRIRLRLTAPSGREFVYYSLRGEAGVLQARTSEPRQLLTQVNVHIRTEQRSYSTGTRLHNQQVVP